MEKVNSLMGTQMEMLEKMIYPSDSNRFLQHIDWTFGRKQIQRIIDCGYYKDSEKVMLNNLREQYINQKYY